MKLKMLKLSHIWLNERLQAISMLSHQQTSAHTYSQQNPKLSIHTRRGTDAKRIELSIQYSMTTAMIHLPFYICELCSSYWNSLANISNTFKSLFEKEGIQWRRGSNEKNVHTYYRIETLSWITEAYRFEFDLQISHFQVMRLCDIYKYTILWVLSTKYQ